MNILAQVEPMVAGAFVPMLLLSIVVLVFLVALLIAPLMIWKHVKGLRKDLADVHRIMRSDQGKFAADVKRIGELIAPAQSIIDCPSCGATARPNASGAAICTGCGAKLQVER